MFGWKGRMLRVDLTSRKMNFENIPDGILKKYLGGRGLGVKIVYGETGPKTDPFGPENVLAFAVGPLTGTLAPTSGRYSVTTKSPLTGTIADANSGGFFGVEFKACGIDALVIKGSAEKPVYLHIKDDAVEILDANGLWGKNVHETTDLLLEKHGKDAKVACIGQAGENLVRIASIMNDKHRAAGRCGVGAVMGSKKLKAIVVEGTGKTEIADKEKMDFVAKEAKKLIEQSPITSKGMPTYGTAGLINLMNYFGILPTKNFQMGDFKKAGDISGEAIKEKVLVKNRACYNCSIACARETRTKTMSGEGPEYETVYALGSCCMVDDIEAITEANYFCNIYGIDTISMGVTIACAMELHEKGLLKENINWGDGKILKELVRKTAMLEGIGSDLAEGSKRMASKYGDKDAAIQVKGLELAGYDPRGSKGQGLSYATSNRGGCHLRSYMVGTEVLGLPKRIDRFSYVNKGGLCAKMQDLGTAIDSLDVCRFSSFAMDEEYYSRILSAVVGFTYTPEDLMAVGERVWNLEKLYNLREGFSRKDDTLPLRLLKEPLKEGASKGHVVELDEMLDEYYGFRGWGIDGMPSEKKISELGLAEERGSM